MDCSSHRVCSICKAAGDKLKFGFDEWNKSDAVRTCKKCVPKRCGKCRMMKKKGLFENSQWALCDGEAVCRDCSRRRCGECDQLKTKGEFTIDMWELADGSAVAKCKACSRKPGMWTCQRCCRQKPQIDFTKVIAKHHGRSLGSLKQKSKRCNECLERFEEEMAAQARRSYEQVQKRARLDPRLIHP